MLTIALAHLMICLVFIKSKCLNVNKMGCLTTNKAIGGTAQFRKDKNIGQATLGLSGYR